MAVFNFMIHTVWFYGQSFAQKEFLAEDLEYNLEFAKDTVFNCIRKNEPFQAGFICYEENANELAGW